MAALTADRLPPRTKFDGMMIDYPVEASEIIFRGAFVEEGTAGVQAADVGGGTPANILGVAQEQADNSAGSAGDIRVKVLVGAVIEHAIASVAFTDMSAPVYCSDDQTLTTTSTTNPLAGHIIQVQTTGTAIVKLIWPGQPAT